MFRSSRDTVTIVPKNVKKVERSGVNTDIAVEHYGCGYCSEGGWTSETEVEVHKARNHFNGIMHHLKRKENVCCICITKFANKHEVVKHIKSEHLLSSEDCKRVEREIFICDVCSAIFFNKQNLSAHINYAHIKHFNIRYSQCPLCMKTFQTPNVPAHFYMHSIQSVSTCRICLIKQKNTKELKEHLKTHPYYLRCNMCYYDTNKLEQFNSHITSIHKSVTAEDVDEDFQRFYIPKLPSYLRLQRVPGVRGIRLANDMHICILCREVCVGTDEMKMHMSEHSIKKEDIVSYKCSCDQVFTNKVLLKHHVFKTKHVLD